MDKLSVMYVMTLICDYFSFKVYSEGILQDDVVKAQCFRTVGLFTFYLLAVDGLDCVVYIAIGQENLKSATNTVKATNFLF